RGIHYVAGEVQHALVAVLAAVWQAHHDFGLLVAGGGRRGTDALELADADGEVHVQRIDLVHRGQQGRLALADQGTLGHALLAGDTGDRRAHGGIAEVDARGLDRRAGSLYRGGIAALARQRVVEVGLRDEVGRCQAAG